jgi:hypothetical protein
MHLSIHTRQETCCFGRRGFHNYCHQLFLFQSYSVGGIGIGIWRPLDNKSTSKGKVLDPGLNGTGPLCLPPSFDLLSPRSFHCLNIHFGLRFLETALDPLAADAFGLL